MKQIVILLLLLFSMLLAACNSSSENQPAPASPVDNELESDTAVSPEQPTESEEALPVANKPQLIEFYAEW